MRSRIVLIVRAVYYATLLAALLYILLPSCAHAQTTYQTTVAALSPCIYYWMDATSGTAEGNHGTATTQTATYVNTPDLNQTGILANASVSPAVTFKSASSEYMTIPGSGASACGLTGRNVNVLTCGSGAAVDSTVIAWLKQTSATQGEIVANTNTDLSSAEWQYFVNTTGSIQGTLFQNGGSTHLGTGATSGTPCTTGAWCMAAFKTTASTHKIQAYTNGTPDSNSTTTTGSCGNADGVVLARRNTNNVYLDGTLDEVAMFDKLVDDADIASLYTLGSTAPATSGRRRIIQSKNFGPLMPESGLANRGNEALPFYRGQYRERFPKWWPKGFIPDTDLVAKLEAEAPGTVQWP